MNLTWIETIMRDPHLLPSAKEAGFSLAAHADDDDVVEASLRDLSDYAGGGEDSWKSMGARVEKLVEAGFLRRLRERKGARPAKYRLTTPTGERKAPVRAPRRPLRTRIDLPAQVREWIETDPEYRLTWLAACDVTAEELDEYLASTPRVEAAEVSGPEDEERVENVAPGVSRPRTIAEIEAARRLSAGGA
jgi:hypothetical protein